MKAGMVFNHTCFLYGINYMHSDKYSSKPFEKNRCFSEFYQISIFVSKPIAIHFIRCYDGFAQKQKRFCRRRELL